MAGTLFTVFNFSPTKIGVCTKIIIILKLAVIGVKPVVISNISIVMTVYILQNCVSKASQLITKLEEKHQSRFGWGRAGRDNILSGKAKSIPCFLFLNLI